MSNIILANLLLSFTWSEVGDSRRKPDNNYLISETIIFKFKLVFVVNMCINFHDSLSRLFSCIIQNINCMLMSHWLLKFSHASGRTWFPVGDHITITFPTIVITNKHILKHLPKPDFPVYWIKLRWFFIVMHCMLSITSTHSSYVMQTTHIWSKARFSEQVNTF